MLILCIYIISVTVQWNEWWFGKCSAEYLYRLRMPSIYYFIHNMIWTTNALLNQAYLGIVNSWIGQKWWYCCKAIVRWPTALLTTVHPVRVLSFCEGAERGVLAYYFKYLVRFSRICNILGPWPCTSGHPRFRASATNGRPTTEPSGFST